ncbi:MAG: TonB-dependent receptor, partial [Chitinophagaceae bacterium]
SPLVAQNIDGHILDKNTGKPLANVHIHLLYINRITTTNTEGYFEMKNIPQGIYKLEAHLKGYKDFSTDIATDTFQNQDLFLSATILELNEVTVVASGIPTTLKRTSTNVKVIKSSNMQTMLPNNMTDILMNIPSVSSLSTGNAIGKPYIRGLGGNRVLIVKNGIRQEEQQWGEEHGVQIDENNIYQLEVYKNPFSLIYGSDALGALIYIETKGFSNMPNQFLTSYESNGNILTEHINYGKKYKNGFSWNLNGTAKLSQDYKNPIDGYVLNSRFQRYGIETNLGIDKSWGYTHFTINTLQQYIGMINGLRDPITGQFLLPNDEIATRKDFLSYKMLSPYQSIRHSTFSIDHLVHLKKHTLKVLLSYQNNFRQEFGAHGHEDGDENEYIHKNISTIANDNDAPDLQLNLHTFDYNIHWTLPKTKTQNILIGMSGIAQFNKNGGEEILLPNYKQLTIGLFGIYQKTFLDKLTWSVGTRGDLRSISISNNENAGFTTLRKNQLNWSFNMGLSYEILDNWIIKLNLGRGFRYPTVAEFSSFGTHPGTNQFEIGNPNLKPELSTQIDLVSNWNSEHVYIEVAGFFNYLQNYIYTERILNTSVTDSIINHTYLVYQYRQNNALLYGIEAIIDIHPHPLDWLHFQNSFSWIRGIFTRTIDHTNNMPLIMQPRWVTELTMTFLKKNTLLRNLYINLQSNYNFAQNDAFTAYNTETTTPAFWLMNTTVGIDIFTKDKKRLSIFLFAKNIFNTAYQSHLSRLKYLPVNFANGRMGVFEPGLNIGVQAIVSLP